MGLSLHAHLFLFASLLSSSLVCDCFKSVQATDSRSYHAFKISSLAPATTCSSSKGSNRTELKIFHLYGPCSQFGRERATHRQILRLDQARVDSLRSRISRTSVQAQAQSQASTLPANLGNSLNYIVTVGFGTPVRKLSVAFDTGSDLTWIQCKPCKVKCYTQQDPVFDPAQSTSYRNISCGSSECIQLSSAGNPSSCTESTCQYSVAYGDGSKTEGFFGQETLTLTPSDVISNFRFGCGQDNDGLFGTAAGLLGLGRDPVSIVSQTAQKYGRVFSYCLPSSSSSEGYLTFGSNGIPSGAKFTPLKTDPNAPSFYFLEMTGIRVGDKDLPIPASTFASPGTIIDSGTVITRLQPDAYSALRTAFREAMSNYSMAPPYMLFDTCYNFTGLDTVSVPTIVLRFNGDADVEVDISGIFYVLSSSQVCLAFAGNKYPRSLGIIGNRQQRTLNVVYDISGERVGFAAGGCS